MKRHRWLILLFIPLIVWSREFSFEQITSADGLSQNNVLGIVQDNYGYMWFATYDGLNRYDGIEFKTYRANDEENGLSSSLLVFLTIDNENNIWVSTFADGICKFDRETETFTQFKNTPENPSVLVSNSINRLYCDSKGTLWAMSTLAGITCLLPETDTSYRSFHIQNIADDPNSIFENQIIEVFEDSKNNTWISTLYSLNLMKKGKDGELRNDFYHLTDSSQHWDIRNITETQEGYLFSHYLGIALLQLNPSAPHDSKITDFPADPMYFLRPDSEGNLWIGGHNGIQYYSYQAGREPLYKAMEFEAVGIPKKLLKGVFIRSMYMDNEGILWMGTNGKGILKHNTRRTWFRHYTQNDNPGSIRNNKVFCFHQDRAENIWVGTEGGGINLLNSSEKKNYKHGFTGYDVCAPGDQNFVHDILDLTIADKKVLWVGSGYHAILVQMDHINNQWTAHKIMPQIDRQVMVLCEDENGSIWIGTYLSGLYKYLPNEGKLLHYTPGTSKMISDIVRNIYEDSRNRLWIGTDKGLMLLSREQKKQDELDFTLYAYDPTDSTSINNNYCVPITETSKRKIWVGTFGGGINIYQEGSSPTQGTFSPMPLNRELPNEMIKAIVEDDYGNFWITTNKGLSKIDAMCTKIRNYTTYDGLQDMQFMDLSAIKLNDGEILIGGINGFNAFYPHEISEDSLPPKIVFNDLEIMNKKVRVNEKIDGQVILPRALNMMDTVVLNHHQNNLRIYFSAIHYLAPKGNIYKYKLENFDNHWTSTTAEFTVARYTNLDPGAYNFNILAANSDGFWTPSPKRLTLIITPAFWQRPWFISLSALLILLTIYGLISFRFFLVKQRNKYLEQVVEQRNRETLEMNGQLKEQAQVLQETAKQLSVQNEELDAHRNRLEQLVEERTKELIEARDKAQESDRLKSKFLASVSHEIRTPMNAIMGFSALLHQPNVKPEKRSRYINQIDTNGKALMNIIDAMIQFSMIDTKQLKISKHQFQLNHLLEVIYDETRTETPPHDGVKLTLNNQLADQKLQLHTDYALVKSIIDELLQNAIKYTQQGTIELYAEGNSEILKIAVKDTGMGIVEENLESIFQSFEKTTSEEAGYKQGIGLGLSISRSMAELLGGSLEVKSELGVGSVFTLSLPLA